MNPVEQALADVSTQLQANTTVLTRIVDALEHLTITNDALVAAMTAPGDVDDEHSKTLRLLVELSREQLRMLRALSGARAPC